MEKFIDFIGKNVAELFIFTTSTAIMMLGGTDKALTTLLSLMAIDYTAGIIKSLKKGTLDSTTGMLGIQKKFTMILIIITAVLLDRMVGLDEANISFRQIILTFYVGMEGISIIENAEEIGVPVHSKIKELFKNLSEKNK